MTQEQLKEANSIKSKQDSLVFFKRNLKEYMEESAIGFEDGTDSLNKIQTVWHRLLTHFCQKYCNKNEAPVLSPTISDPDGMALYEDLCAVADKWIDIYEKRLEEI